MALSQPVGALLEALATPDPEGFDCDVLIVGSGYGGAVAAARLAGATRGGAPLKVWLVERGQEWQPGEFPSRFAELPGHVRASVGGGKGAGRVVGRAESLLDFRLGGDVAVLLGNGLGGGSLINANVMLRPEDGVFAQGWPRDISPTELDAAYARALAVLQPAPLPATQSLRKLDLLQSLTPEAPAVRAPVTVAWHDTDPARPAFRPLKACTLCGDCMTGCNVGAKGSLDTSYLARASAGGVAMFTGVSASHLAREGGRGEGAWLLHWQPTRTTQRGAQVARPVRARHVILAAGSLGSTEILMRSRELGLALSDALGEGFSMNGDVIAAGYGHAAPTGTAADPELDPAGNRRHIGPTITGVKRVAASGCQPGFVVEEFGVPGALRRVFGEIVATLAAARYRPWPGRDPAGVSEADIAHMSCFGLMGDDGAAGRLTLPPQRTAGLPEGQIQVSWPGINRLPLFTAMRGWLATQFARQGARSVAPPEPLTLAGQAMDCVKVLWRAVKTLVCRLINIGGGPVHRLLDFGLLHIAPWMKEAEVLDLVGGNLGLAVTVHPLGGCRMADTVGGGVVDAEGRVFDPAGGCYPGLAVLDGAILPRALGINPALTITALAERALPRLIKSWGFEPSSTEPKPQARARPLRRQPLPAAEASWRLEECLQGPLVQGPRRWWARLEACYEDIPGFARALALPERVLNLRRATLSVFEWPAAAGTDLPELEFPPRGLVPRWRADLGGQLRLFMPLESGDGRVTLDYRLSVLGLEGNAADAPLRVGSSLFARKVVGLAPGERFDRVPSWLRQLTEADVEVDGVQVGRWQLDLDRMSTYREPLLTLAGHSNLPDALLDAATGATHVTRLLRSTLVQAYTVGALSAWAPNLLAKPDVRWPGVALGVTPVRIHHPDRSGARLSRYRFDAGRVGSRAPVLLIHGMGASGNSYTLDCLRAAGPSLLQLLAGEGRDVWVLDVRSSTANEAGRASANAEAWRAEGVAELDIRWALEHVHEATGEKVDVFGHCMGAVMLWMAVLGKADVGQHIRAAVFSQVGPKLLPTAMNRLRGFVASSLVRYLQLREVDTCPEFEFHEGAWRLRPTHPDASDAPRALRDALLATYPYPDDDREAERADAMGQHGWRGLRHRADAIFGQLFELGQMHDETLLQLDALLGWVKMPMLEQAIQFARLKRIVDADGRDDWVSHEQLRARLSFPLLMLHGRRNRVFDWRGSVYSLQRIHEALGATQVDVPVPPVSTAQTSIYGAGSQAELRIYEGYGHLDCVIGQHAGRDVLRGVLDFWKQLPGLFVGPVRPAALTAVTPWIGPQLGWLRVCDPPAGQVGGWLALTVLLQRKSHQDGAPRVALVPVRWRGNAPEVLSQYAEVFDLPAAKPGPGPQALHLRFERSALEARANSWALLLLDRDEAASPMTAGDFSRWWLNGKPGSRPGPDTLAAFDKLLKHQATLGLFDDCQLRLPPKVLDAADGPLAANAAFRPLQLALASCQYPPDLFNRECASAHFERLLDDARLDDGPQALLLTGDQVYLDATAGVFDPATHIPVGGPQRAERLLRESYQEVARLPARRRCLARLPTYPILDDHEVGDDWRGRLAQPNMPGVDVLNALAAYERWQHALAPTRQRASYGYRLNLGGVPVFVLDTRSMRTPGTPAAPGSGTLMPPAEMAALIADLKALPDAVPKFVVSPAPLLPPRRVGSGGARLFEDDWMGFPASSQQLLTALRGIRHVTLLAGDSHLSSVSRLDFDNGNRLLAVVSSGLYSPWPFANQRPEELTPSGPLGPEVLGLPATLTVEAVSTTAGYALVTLRQNEDQRLSLSVALRGAGPTLRLELTWS